MSSHDLQSSRQIWTEYWRSGRRGCLTDEAPVSARDHVAGLWRSWFRQQPQGARIVDLACGAGEVARIAFSVAAKERLGFVIEGVDLAEFDGAVETRASESGTTMRLHSGIDIARMPFPDGSFDCAVSQFGIEYADERVAGRELARVLKRDARGLFLVHHRESAISAAATTRLQAFDAVIADGVVLDRARDVYQSIAAGADESVIAMRLSEFRRRLRIARAAYSAGFAWETNLHEVLGFLSDLARNPRVYDPRDAMRRIDAAREGIKGWKSRLSSQLAAARDRNGVEVLAGAIRSVGFDALQIEPISDPSSALILAWQLAFAAR